jgi:hypothetical protein
MARSLLRQLEQIRRSALYDDNVTWDSVDRGVTAEPTVSGSLQEDMNVVRTMIKEMSGGANTNWFDAMGTYPNPTNSGEPYTANLATMKGNTLDAKTVIIAVSDYGPSDAGFAVTSTSSGIMRDIGTTYGTFLNTIGLPVFASTANTGVYADEGGYDNVCRIDVINQDDAEFTDPSGNVIYAKMHDGKDYATYSGSGQDVYFKFYTNDVECTLSGALPAVPTAVKFVYPQRKQMSTMEEYDWLRTDFISSWEGDVELVEDISNLWAFTGSGDNVDTTVFDNNAANYLLEANPTDLFMAIDQINDGVGDRDYASYSYLSTGETIVSSLQALATQVQTNEDATTAAAGEKYVESIAAPVTAGVEHSLPVAIGAYTTFSGAGQEGKNMDVYVDGQLLAADTGQFGVNADRDYGETSVSGITFRFALQVGRNVTYVVRQ